MSRRCFRVEAVDLGVLVEVQVDHADTATRRDVARALSRALTDAKAMHDASAQTAVSP